jgi:hypothetical protein
VGSRPFFFGAHDQELGVVMCDLAEARASTTWWAQQGVQEGCADAPSAVADSSAATEDVLLSTVLLHCFAHAALKGASHPQNDGYVKLCKCAATLAVSAWDVPNRVLIRWRRPASSFKPPHVLRSS